MGNTGKQGRLGLCQDSDFAGDLEDSKSTSGGLLCIFGKPYVCSNQLDVQETNFSFAQFNRIRNHFLGRRIEVGPALDLRDLIVAVLHTYQSNHERRNPCTNQIRVNLHKLPTRKIFHGMIDDLDNVDFLSSNVHSSRKEALLYIFEDNEAVMKMIM